MKKNLFLALASGMLWFASSTQAQTPCITDEMHHLAKQQFPGLAQEEEMSIEATRLRVEEFLNQRQFTKSGTVIYIPVVFHVIHNDGLENITQAQIMDQLRILNEDFRKMAGTNGGSSTNPLAVDMEFEFRLAQFDPNGERHDGINRIKSSLTVDARNNVKGLIQWDPRKYLNIWVVQSINNSSGGGEGTVLGFAQFPSTLSFSPGTDGIVIRADYTGNIQTGVTSNAGRTLTHEVGHWIGLFHTFQGGCVGGLSSNCSSQGDQVCDTPPVAASNFGCLPETSNSCSNDSPNLPDQIRNYMDYSDGTCMNMYTPGQKARALAQMGLYRSQIYSAANLLAAGINPNGTYVTVPASDIKAPYAYSFEDPNVTNAGWTIQNLNSGSKGWNLDATVAFTGSRSIALRNFTSVLPVNNRSEFFSPLIDLTPLSSGGKVTFRVAYARKATNTNDILTLGISDDFGRTETIIYNGTLGNLESAPVQSSEFIPSAQNQWRMITVNLAPYLNMTHARFRFEFRSRMGNNIFIDDFEISSSTGVYEQLKQDMAFNVFPNPMQESALIQLNNKKVQPVQITLCDLAGRTLKTMHNGNMSAGAQEIKIEKAQLTNGIYFVRIETPEGSFAHKLVISE